MTEFSNLTPIEKTDRGEIGAAVFVQDQTTDLLDLPFLQLVSDDSVLAADTVRGAFTIEAEPGHSLVVGRILELANGDNIFYQATILSIAVNTITLDQPINHVYTSGRPIFQSTSEMQVIGTPGAPQVFSIQPLQGQSGDIVRIILIITSTADQDFETFGADPALTTGLTLRVKKKSGDFRNIFNWKNNGEFQQRAFDASYQTNKGGSVRAFTSRRTFGGQSKNGVVIRLDGDRGEELQVVIPDDLVTGSVNTSFKMFAQGHELQETP